MHTNVISQQVQRYRGSKNFKYGGLHLNILYIVIYINVYSLFNIFLCFIYSNTLYLCAVLPKQEKHVKMNDSFIFIHHIHAYRKKIIHPKVHKYLDFYVTEK